MYNVFFLPPATKLQAVLLDKSDTVVSINQSVSMYIAPNHNKSHLKLGLEHTQTTFPYEQAEGDSDKETDILTGRNLR